MKLKEHIKVLKKHSQCHAGNCSGRKCRDCEFYVPFNKLPTDADVLAYLVELDDLRRIIRSSRAIDLITKKENEE